MNFLKRSSLYAMTSAALAITALQGVYSGLKKPLVQQAPGYEAPVRTTMIEPLSASQPVQHGDGLYRVAQRTLESLQAKQQELLQQGKSDVKIIIGGETPTLDHIVENLKGTNSANTYIMPNGQTGIREFSGAQRASMDVADVVASYTTQQPAERKTPAAPHYGEAPGVPPYVPVAGVGAILFGAGALVSAKRSLYDRARSVFARKHKTPTPIELEPAMQEPQIAAHVTSDAQSYLPDAKYFSYLRHWTNTMPSTGHRLSDA